MIRILVLNRAFQHLFDWGFVSNTIGHICRSIYCLIVVGGRNRSHTCFSVEFGQSVGDKFYLFVFIVLFLRL